MENNELTQGGQPGLSQSNTGFYNIHFIDNQELSEEEASRAGSALFVDNNCQANELNKKMLGFNLISSGAPEQIDVASLI